MRIIKSFFLIFFCGFTLIVYANNNKQDSLNVTVDERVELMSAIFRKIQAPEYYYNVSVSDYKNKLDSVLSPYGTHPLLLFLVNLRQKTSVAYDAVMEMAVNLKIDNGKIEFLPETDICNIDARWICDSIPRFLLLLNDFYSVTDFH
jgi:hypothetical protein